MYLTFLDISHPYPNIVGQSYELSRAESRKGLN
jgi:hypothetical protein